MQIEKTILDSVFDVADGSIDAAQAYKKIIDQLPWDEIDTLGSDDPVNIRFRRGTYVYFTVVYRLMFQFRPKYCLSS